MKPRARRLEIPDVILLEQPAFGDHRGLLIELHRESTRIELGIPGPFVQTNLSRSKRGVLRGLHYQHPPAAQGKLVHVIQGEVFDVAVDLRKGSPTYAQWIGYVLSHLKPESLYIPPGFAHGFCALAERTDVVYLMTSEYSEAHQAGVIWNDADLDIAWPIREPVLSKRDAQLSPFREADIRFVYQSSDPQHAQREGSEL